MSKADVSIPEYEVLFIFFSSHNKNSLISYIYPQGLKMEHFRWFFPLLCTQYISYGKKFYLFFCSIFKYV